MCSLCGSLILCFPSFAFKEKKAKFCSRFETLTGHVSLIRSRPFPSKVLDGRNQTKHFLRRIKKTKKTRQIHVDFSCLLSVFEKKKTVSLRDGTNFELDYWRWDKQGR